MKKLLLVSALLLTSYQSFLMASHETSVLSKQQLQMMKSEVLSLRDMGILDWINKNIHTLQKNSLITSHDLEIISRANKEADEANQINKNVMDALKTKETSSGLPVVENDESENKMNHYMEQAIRAREKSATPSKAVYSIIIKALNKALGETSSYDQFTSQPSRFSRRKLLLESIKEEDSAKSPSPSSALSTLPKKLETLTEEDNEEELSSEETTDSEETSPSTSGSTSMSSSTSITPRSSSPSVTLGVTETYSQENPVELQAVVIDERKDTVVPIEITSGSQVSSSMMPIFAHRQPQLPRVMRDLEEFKFLSFPFAGAFAGAGAETSGQQQLGSQRPQTPAQTAQRIRGLFQSSAAKQKTMAEEKKS